MSNSAIITAAGSGQRMNSSTKKQFIEIEDSFDKKIIRDNALRFSAEIFKEKIKTFIDKKYGEHTNKKI